MGILDLLARRQADLLRAQLSSRDSHKDRLSGPPVAAFGGLLKRGVDGVYHRVGQQHLHRYLTESAYGYNSRKEADSMRTVQALKSTTGKRLMLRDSRQANRGGVKTGRQVVSQNQAAT